LKNNILTHSLTYQSENKNISSKTTTIHKFFHPKKNQITLHSCNNSINSLALATIWPTTHIQKRDGERNQSIEKRFAIAELERSCREVSCNCRTQNPNQGLKKQTQMKVGTYSRVERETVRQFAAW
jgi:hypothetical protein